MITWLTPAGTIGTISEETYYEFQFDAYSSYGNPITYSIITGQLSSGLALTPSGLVRGLPVITSIVNATVYTQTFTLRAKDTVTGKISDRTFSITINAISLPQIYPANVSLGTFFDGHNLNLQLLAHDPNPLAPLTWSILSGELPGGVTLTPDGLLTGHIIPFTNNISGASTGWDQSPWDQLQWDTPSLVASSKTYTFTVRVFDGVRYNKSQYQINVVAKSLYSIDNTQIPVDITTVTVDLDNLHLPFINTKSQLIPTQRQISKFAFDIIGQDLDHDQIFYELYVPPTIPVFDLIAKNSILAGINPALIVQGLPPGITTNSIDKVTGWIRGEISTQTSAELTYVFQVRCYKSTDVYFKAHTSEPVTLAITILGEINDTITWITPNNLGKINNGAISELSIVAKSDLGKTLTYTITNASRLPQGLKFLPNGLIVGRVSFKYFSMDKGKTTFDGKSTSFDDTFTLNVTAADYTNPSGVTISSTNVFTVSINDYNITPYENLYLKSLPKLDERLALKDILADQSIFPDQLIYRQDDPWFGKAKDIKILFAAGLTPSNASTFLNTMQNNHYDKMISLGNVKTAVALDENFNVKYEVVYLEVMDSTYELKQPMSLDRTNQVSAPYNVPPYTTVYPDSFSNMYKEVTTVGYANRGAIPQWMQSPQPDGRVIGFIEAVVLAYTVPGASSLIAYRLSQKNISFNKMDFVVDRYQLDQLLSQNYDINTGVFIPSESTTFDNSSTLIDHNATRFISNEDKFEQPEIGHIYLKFPKVDTYGPEIF